MGNVKEDFIKELTEMFNKRKSKMTPEQIEEAKNEIKELIELMEDQEKENKQFRRYHLIANLALLTQCVGIAVFLYCAIKYWNSSQIVLFNLIFTTWLIQDEMKKRLHKLNLNIQVRISNGKQKIINIQEKELIRAKKKIRYYEDVIKSINKGGEKDGMREKT